MTMSDYLTRLGIALPLILLLLGLLFVAAKRGWLPLAAASLSSKAAAVTVIQSAPLGAGMRLVAVEFDGRRLLLATHRGGVTVVDAGPAR